MFKNDAMNLNEAYDWATFTLTTGTSDYDVKGNQSNLWKNIARARKVVIETTKNISVKFNSTSYPAVALDAGESPMELIDKLDVIRMYLTNSSGSDSTIRIWLFL